jgi:phosphate transport system protein
MANTVEYQFVALTSELAEMCAMAAEAMNRATHALLLADIESADAVIAEHKQTVAMSSSVEETAFLLLALQPTLAANLREVANAIRIAADAERMGELAVRVAEIARKHYPDLAVPAEIIGRVAELSACAVELARVDQEELLANESELEAYRCSDDSVVDELHRQLLAILIEPESRSDLAAGVDVAVLSELYERFADHAAQIARRLDYRTNDHHFSAEPLVITA